MSSPSYLTTTECAARYGCTARLWRQRCEGGRVPGAVKYGRDWLIPDASAAGYRPRPTGRPPTKASGPNLG